MLATSMKPILLFYNIVGFLYRTSIDYFDEHGITQVRIQDFWKGGSYAKRCGGRFADFISFF